MTRGTLLASDKDGNILTITEGSGPYGNNYLQSNQVSYVLAKHDKDLNLKWAAGILVDEITDLAVDEGGNIYFTGATQTGFKFYSSTNNTVISQPVYANSTDAFLAKYDKDGAPIYANRWGVEGDKESGTALKADAKGNIIVTGWMEHPIGQKGPSIYNYYLYKFSSAGILTWKNESGWKNHFYPNDLAVDAYGNCYVVGNIVDTAWFNNTMLPASYYQSFFIAKYQGNGNLSWAIQKGSNGISSAKIAVDKSLNIYTLGRYSWTTKFDNVPLSTGNSTGMFIAKLDSVGNTLWINIAENAEGTDLITNMDEDCLIAGDYSEHCEFKGSGAPSLTGTKYSDGFVVKYGAGGQYKWVLGTGGNGISGETVPLSIANLSDLVYISGSMSEGTVFGKFSFYNAYNGPSGKDQFICRINLSDNLAGIFNQSAINDFYIYPVPSQKNITVYLNNFQVGSVEIVLTNITGEVVYTENSNVGKNQSFNLDLSPLPKGLYFVSITSAQNKLTKKLIIE
jgi:hypothetical protein